ncbi:hypothetical protein D3C71_24180 [compost metagenome]
MCAQSTARYVALRIPKYRTHGLAPASGARGAERAQHAERLGPRRHKEKPRSLVGGEV